MTGDDQDPRPEGRRFPLPGVAAIALYLLIVAGVIVLGVVSGGHYPALYLIFAVLFTTASAGLIASFRWAWALTLSAVFLLMAYNLWLFTAQHQLSAGVQGGLNLVFFLYLIRPEVRATLR